MTSNHSDYRSQHSNGTQQSSQDTLQSIAIREGTQQIDRDEIEEVSLQFTDSEAMMLKKLTSSLALSVKVVVESAISYVYFYTKDRNLKVDQLPEYRQTLGSRTFKLELATEIAHKLDELGMAHQLSECAVTGIRLLYHQLIETVSVEV
jgi:hypothetical protein